MACVEMPLAHENAEVKNAILGAITLLAMGIENFPFFSKIF